MGSEEIVKKFDVLIIGGGAAGLTAAIYTRRKELTTGIISVDIGGQNLLTEQEENYPGYTGMSGPKLMEIFFSQALKFGADSIAGKVSKIEKLDDHFKVTLTNGEQYESQVVILAHGKIPKSLGIPGEDKFIGRGVSSCATCDAPFYKSKNVVVIGGGNSALEAAELLTKFATKIYLIHRRDSFRGDEITQKKVKEAKNVEIIYNSIPVEIKGKDKLEAIVVEDVNTKKQRELKVDGVFVEIGHILDTEFAKDFVDRNELNEIKANRKMETKTPGIFAAGDVTDGPFKQTITAAGDGATAGLSAYNYLMKKQGKATIKADWS
jgi:thioredoxin-disulfide reductase